MARPQEMELSFRNLEPMLPNASFHRGEFLATQELDAQEYPCISLAARWMCYVSRASHCKSSSLCFAATCRHSTEQIAQSGRDAPAISIVVQPARFGLAFPRTVPQRTHFHFMRASESETTSRILRPRSLLAYLPSMPRRCQKVPTLYLCEY